MPPDIRFPCLCDLTHSLLFCLIVSHHVSQECLTLPAGNEPNMTYKCMHVEERLQYGGPHLVYTSDWAGKRIIIIIQSKMIVDIIAFSR